jgi:hypothetical protein
MKKSFYILFLVCSVVNAQNAFYVAVDGNDSNDGSKGSPWQTWQKGFTSGEPGDTVFIRGGVWYPTDYYGVSKSVVYVDPYGKGYGPTGNDGKVENPICIFAYPGETPILDCSQVDTIGETFNVGITFYNANYYHIRGITLRNVYQINAGRYSQIATGISGTNSTNFTFENITVHDIGGRGFSYFTAFGVPENEGGPLPTPGDTTKWINCDVYNCADPYSYTGHPNQEHDPYNGGDGWKCQNYGDAFFLFDGCRAWNCSDDGFDPSGSQVTVIRNCWSFYNGWYASVLDGNGFKTGGVTVNRPGPSRFVYNCISAFNFRSGLYDLDYSCFARNNSRIFNNTFYKNGWGVYAEDNTCHPEYISHYYNNIAYKSTEYGPTGKTQNVTIYSSDYTESHNTWDMIVGATRFPWDVESDSFIVTDNDFFIFEDKIAISQLKEDRDIIDGSLPDITFLSLKDGSDLIDKGTPKVGLPYNGDAPDLGAKEFEYQSGSNYSNRYPIVELLNPGEGSSFTTSEEILINASAEDIDGEVTKVVIFDFGKRINEVLSEPWSFVWESPSIGDHLITAVAYDNLGAKATSSAISLTVIPSSSQSTSGNCFVFPNPNDGNFNLFIGDPRETSSVFNICSLNGQMVYEGYIPKNAVSVKIPALSHISPGAYIIWLQEYDNCSPSMFVKE